ncbi:MAG: hypothetical protein H0Z34_10935 [Brevibacillus sp.]|nr:hypothetical protein [Brevibacillus sp.]
MLTTVKMIPQAIVDLETKELVMQEWLCRPLQQSVQEFFSAEDPETLWQREEICIRTALEMDSRMPRMMNLTLSSLPFFLQTSLKWEGGVEIVEWGIAYLSSFEYYAEQLRDRGLQIWIDDLSPDTWEFWKRKHVDGYKVDIRYVLRQPDFFCEVQAVGKPVVVERIETLEMEKQAMQFGGKMGQGFLYEQSARTDFSLPCEFNS